MEEIFITKTVIENVESDEDLHWKLREMFIGEDDNYDKSLNEINLSYGMTDNEPIELDLLLGILTKMKEKGSTHVQLDYHSDHLTYILSGIEIRPSTEDEIQRFKKYHEEKNKLDAEILKHNQEIRELQREIKKL